MEEELKESKIYMLTTIDNPYNPWLDYESWFAFDQEKKYFSCSYLARVLDSKFGTKSDYSSEEIQKAINEIVLIDPLSLYIRISKDQKVKPVSVEFL